MTACVVCQKEPKAGTFENFERKKLRDNNTVLAKRLFLKHYEDDIYKKYF